MLAVRAVLRRIKTLDDIAIIGYGQLAIQHTGHSERFTLRFQYATTHSTFLITGLGE
jgi:hypothetical protein